MLILIEGPKNSGKSFLIEKLKGNGFHSYKFPFIPYFKKFIAQNGEDTGKDSPSTYHFTTSFDVSLLSLNKEGLLPFAPLLVDRSFLSNIVLGILQGRTTEHEGKKYIDWLVEQGYLENIRIIYVDKENKGQGRTEKKDDWEFLEYEKQAELFQKFLDYLHKEHNIGYGKFINKFDNESVGNFAKFVLKMNVNGFITKVVDFLFAE